MKVAFGEAKDRVRSLAAAGILTLFGLASPAWSGNGDVDRVDMAHLATLIDSGVPVVDVRRADEWRATGVIPGSLLITAFGQDGRLDPRFVERVREAIGPDRSVALICRSGNRSAQAARVLIAAGGFTEVYDVAGGMRDWIAAGRPTAPCARC